MKDFRGLATIFVALSVLLRPQPLIPQSFEDQVRSAHETARRWGEELRQHWRERQLLRQGPEQLTPPEEETEPPGWYKPQTEPQEKLSAPDERESPPTTVELLDSTLDRQVKQLEKQLAHLSLAVSYHQQILQSLRNIPYREDLWQRDLLLLAQQSQSAQAGAVMACASLVLANLADIEVALQAHGLMPSLTPEQASAFVERSDQIRALLSGVETKAGPSLATRVSAISDLLLRQLTTLLESQGLPGERLFVSVQSLTVQALETVGAIQSIQEPNLTSDLLLVQKFLQDSAVDIIAKAGLKAIGDITKQESMLGSHATVKFGTFIVNYGYQSALFYEAWSGVHLMLSRLQDKERLAAACRDELQSAVRRRSVYKKYVESLQAARSSDDPELKVVALSELDTAQAQEGWLSGSWYWQLVGNLAAPVGSRTGK